jgi:hypothetical protein
MNNFISTSPKIKGEYQAKLQGEIGLREQEKIKKATERRDKVQISDEDLKKARSNPLAHVKGHFSERIWRNFDNDILGVISVNIPLYDLYFLEPKELIRLAVQMHSAMIPAMYELKNQGFNFENINLGTSQKLNSKESRVINNLKLNFFQMIFLRCLASAMVGNNNTVKILAKYDNFLRSVGLGIDNFLDKKNLESFLYGGVKSAENVKRAYGGKIDTSFVDEFAKIAQSEGYFSVSEFEKLMENIVKTITKNY